MIQENRVHVDWSIAPEDAEIWMMDSLLNHAIWAKKGTVNVITYHDDEPNLIDSIAICGTGYAPSFDYTHDLSSHVEWKPGIEHIPIS